MQVASAHTQAPIAQTQLNSQQGDPEDNGTAANGKEDSPDPGETSGSAEDQHQYLSGGGHKDQGQADHQFEGTE